MSGEIIAFILYFICMIGIGIIVFVKNKNSGESDYFLGGRKMGPFVTGLSAQASDMSGWLLMGFPGSILAAGFGKVWIAIGLALGSYLSWLLVARRLRVFSQEADDSITIPQYLNNRFKASGLTLQIVCAVVFFVCFSVYVASGFKAGAKLFNTVMGLNSTVSMVLFAFIIIIYTLTGGFRAVCYTDFFQALLMLGALIIVPIVILATHDVSIASVTAESPNYFNLLPSGKFDYESFSDIISGLAWGFGYFGMPHIIIRFMSIADDKKIKTSRRTATAWVVASLAMAVVIGLVGRMVLPELVTGDKESVFIQLVRMTFPGFISGILLSAILAAAMSTADSQLLVASSAVTSDIYKPMVVKKAEREGKQLNKSKLDKQIVWIGRSVVILIAIAAFIIANIPGGGGIMDLVENAWAGFGAAFGPVILLSLYWKRITYKGALAGIIGGALTVVIWIIFLSETTGIYELFPGFIVGMLATLIVSLLDKQPSKDVEALFNRSVEKLKN